MVSAFLIISCIICSTCVTDPVVTPEVFAQSVVEDYALAPSYHQVIVKSIQDQLSDFRIHSTNPDGEYIPSEFDNLKGELDEEDADWWEAWRKRLRTERGTLRSARRGDGNTRRRRKRAPAKDEPIESDNGVSILDTSLPADVDDIELDESRMVEDMRILIKVSQRWNGVSSLGLMQVLSARYHCWVYEA